MPDRGSLYGDGFFESIYCDPNGHLPLWDLHLNRMRHACETYQITWNQFWDSLQFRQEVQRCAGSWPARIRLTVFRDGAGLYLPKIHLPNYILQASSLSDDRNWLGISALIKAPESAEILRNISKLPSRSATFSDYFKYADHKGMAHIKSISAAFYVQAAIEIDQKGADEGILLNHHGQVCECLSSNIWVAINGICYCPPPESGAIQGVMQQYLLNEFPDSFQQSTSPITKEDLFNAELVFCSNAVRGISRLRVMD